MAAWKYFTRTGHPRETELWLQPELDYSPMVDDFYGEPGHVQLAEYVDYLKRHKPELLEADAVPIYWSVLPAHETAPFFTSKIGHKNFLTYYTWPVHAATGKPIDWFRMPVRHSRFPEFGRALGWKPSPLQRYAPLRSIIEHREVLVQVRSAGEPVFADYAHQPATNSRAR